MIGNIPKVLAVILARGGSKGIPLKNIANINGHPLISYSITAALKSKLVNKIVVSTDSEQITKVSRIYGADVPFKRSSRLSGDKITSAEALRDAVIKSEKIFRTTYDFIIELPCVSPFRDNLDIDNALKILINNKKLDSVISYVNTGEKHPVRLKRIVNGKVTNFCKEYKESKFHSRRQDFEPCFIRNGAIYAMRRDVIIKKKNREGSYSFPFIMPQEKSLNIDEKFDLKLASLMIEDGMCNNQPSLIPNEDKFINNKRKKNILITTPTFFFDKQIKQDTNFNYIIVDKKNDKISQLKKYFEKTNIWICNPCPNYKIDYSLISKFKNLEILATPSTGESHIDRKSLQKKKIKLISLKNSGFEKKIFASSEYTFLMILSLVRKLPESIAKVKSGSWRNIENDLRGIELRGKTIGIIGYGRIGSNIAKFSKPMGVKTIYYDPFIKLKNKNSIKFKNHKKVLEKSDIILVSCHLNQQTYQMVDESWFKYMKKGVYFINSSRGEIINEADLIKYIKNKHIKAAFLDVIQNENVPQEQFKKKNIIKLSKKIKNLYISPHIAGLTYDSETKAFKSIIKMIKNENKKK